MTDSAARSLSAQGMALLRAGRGRDAEPCFRKALAANPSDAQALLGLGIIAHQTGHFAPALELFERAGNAAPGIAAIHVNHGNTLAAMGRYHDATVAFGQALAIAPNLPSAHINLAGALHSLGRLDDAVAALERARVLQPEAPGIHNNLGNLYKDQGRLNDALSCYDQALRLHPMLQQAASNRLTALKLDASMTPARILREHRRWANWFEAVSTNAPMLRNAPDPSRRLRIGYVAPDCHTAVPAFLDPVIAMHDRNRFEVFCYFNNLQSSTKLASLGVNATSRFMRGLDDQQVATQIHGDGIDILIDIAGHAGHNRLGVFARKPAPVQITWLDYLCTTGLAAMDYRITDAIADPPGSDEFQSEKLLRMPATQWCWSAAVNAPPVTALPAATRGFITFGSFNHAQKLTDGTLALWAALLDALSRSRLLIAGLPEGAARRRVEAGLCSDPTRLTFLPRTDAASYRRAIGEVDIALDPAPFSGAATTLDALWQGVPVLTLPGVTSCSRSSASLLMACGLPDWVSCNEIDFVARAVRHAANPDALARVRAELRTRLAASPIMDRSRFVRDLERLYREAWARHCTARRDAAGHPNREAGAHDALAAAMAGVDAGRIDEAMSGLKAILWHRPHWEAAKQVLAHTALPWARLHPDASPAWAEPAKTVAPCRVSVIVCSIRPEYFVPLREKVLCQFPGHEVEVIGIHDARSLCEGYNRGAARAAGDILVFCHDDIDLPHADFGTRVLAHLQEHDVIGVAGADALVDGDWGHAGPPHVHGQILHRPGGAVGDEQGHLYLAVGLHGERVAPVRALDGVLIAAHRCVWEALRFDEQTFDGFHLYDIDFTYRAHKAGYRVGAALDLLLVHFSIGRYDMLWQQFNLRFLAKFPELSGLPSIHRSSFIHAKLQTLEQVERMHSALRHFRFGDCVDHGDGPSRAAIPLP